MQVVPWSCVTYRGDMPRKAQGIRGTSRDESEKQSSESQSTVQIKSRKKTNKSKAKKNRSTLYSLSLSLSSSLPNDRGESMTQSNPKSLKTFLPSAVTSFPFPPLSPRVHTWTSPTCVPTTNMKGSRAALFHARHVKSPPYASWASCPRPLYQPPARTVCNSAALSRSQI